MDKGRCIRRVGVVLVVAGLAGAAFIPGAGADASAASTYSVAARADAFAVEYLNTAAPVFADNAVVYGTPATAGSLLDSVGKSTAFASAPYPGDLMVGMPDNGRGVVANFGGPPELVPTYPFYVRSEYPITPDAAQDQSGNRLVAHSEEHGSHSDARSGIVTGDLFAAGQAQAASSAALDAATGTLTAMAASRLDGLRITDKLQIAKSTSHAKLVAEPGQPIVKESSFTIGSIVVNGVEFSYSDKGLRAGDQSGPPAEPSAAFAPLEQAGIHVEFLPATGTDTSIESAGMRISQVQQFGGQTQRVSIILGRVSTRIDGSAAPATDSLLDPVPADGAGTSAEGDGVASAAPAPSPPEVPPTLAGASFASGDAASLPAFSQAAGFGIGASGSPATAPTPAVASPAPTPETTRLASPARALGLGLQDDDVTGLYLAVAVSGAVMVFGTRLLGALGVRRGPRAEGASVLTLPHR